MALNRRRFLSISAAASAALIAPMSKAEPARHWTGQALGARASIRLDHPDVEAIVQRCLAEIDRLESILSLYRPESALSRLNRDGLLDAPPFELVDCLAQAGVMYRASRGAFDVTVQPLWALWAERGAAGQKPTEAEIEAALGLIGFDRVQLSAQRISMDQGMALTLNGIGQGYVADRVAHLLKAEGLTNILIDTGELSAIGGRPEGGGWPVVVEGRPVALNLQDGAMATSALLGTTFDKASAYGHILDPRTGRPAMSLRKTVTILAPTAAMADALATAACLVGTKLELEGLLSEFPEAQLLHS